MLDTNAILRDFPLLRDVTEHGRRICYLDSGATSQKPQCVIDLEREYYEHFNANVHRGVYAISEAATEATEATREKVRAFINAASTSEIIYTRNATEAVNLVARTYGEASLWSGDTVILTEMEHHANLVPWHILASRRGINLEFVPVKDDFTLDLDVYRELLREIGRASCRERV